MIGDRMSAFFETLEAADFIKLDTNLKYDLHCLLRIRNWAMTSLPVEVSDAVVLRDDYVPQGDFRGVLEAGMTGTVTEVLISLDEKSWRVAFLADHDGRTYSTLPMDAVTHRPGVTG